MSTPDDIPALEPVSPLTGVNTMSDTAPDDFEELLTVLPTARFPLGQVQIAADTAYELDRAFVESCLRRHASGDCGEVDPDVKIENGRTMHGEGVMPIVSRFCVGDRILQIVTKADGSVTSIVLFAADGSASPAGAWAVLPALEHVLAVLKLRHLDQVDDDDVEEAIAIGDAAIAGAKKRCG